MQLPSQCGSTSSCLGRPVPGHIAEREMLKPQQRFSVGMFSKLSHTSDLEIGTPVATLPGTWGYRLSARTGCLGVSVQSLGEIESLICNFCHSVAAH